MAKKNTATAGQGAASDPLLPTVGVPGTYEWCEEVVECMNAAWRARETSEQGFIAAVRAALQHRIWETLSPPPPQEPYTSLENLIRRTADAGQAENMQLVIKFSGVQAAVERRMNDAPPWEEGVLAAGTVRGTEARAPFAGEDAGDGLVSDPEVALGEALLAQFAAQLGARLEDEGEGMSHGVGIAAGPAGRSVGGGAASPAQPRISAAQRKRERLERTHPDLIDAVEAGEMTLKQAYVEAGIEKQVRTIDKLQKLWNAASEEERDRFRSWLDEQMAKERKRAYQEEVYGDDA